MIKKITFKNFFSFKDTTIDLESENILIGINGSGKSNFLRAFELLGPVANYKLKDLTLSEWGGFSEIFYAGKTEGKDISIEYEIDGKLLDKNLPFSVFYLLSFIRTKGLGNYVVTEKLYFKEPSGKNVILLSSNDSDISIYTGSYGKGELYSKRYDNPDSRESVLYRNADEERTPILENLKMFFESFSVYHYFETGSNSQIRKPIIATSQNKLSKEGGNLAQILNTFGIVDRSIIKLIKEKLVDVNPTFEDINFNFLGGNIELLLSEKELNRAIHTSKISDGTLHFLCLLSILYNPNRGSIVCLDEPETGLHPDMISAIAEGIKYAAQTSQIIVATHSDLLLNHFEFSDILVFRKDANNATQIDRPSKEDFKWMENEPAVYFRGNFGVTVH